MVASTNDTDSQRVDMETTNIIDYAMPLMQIERMAKEIHDLCLDRKYDEAWGKATFIGVEVRILQASLALLQEKENRFANPKSIQAE